MMKQPAVLPRAVCTAFVLAAAAVVWGGLLAGCDTMRRTATLDNVPVCEVAPSGRRAYVNSMLGWLGLSFKLTDRSAAVMCPDETVKDKTP